MLHFGSYHRSESLQIEMQDVASHTSDDADTNFPHPSKWHAEGFSYEMSSHANPTFRKHMAQLAQKTDKNLGF